MKKKMLMTPQEVAADIAQELTEHPERWIQGSFAETKNGCNVDYTSRHAVRWCLLGHIHRRTQDGSVLEGLTVEAFHANLSDVITRWNDRKNRKVGSVIRLCKKVAKA